jgi:hypothetical protein
MLHSDPAHTVLAFVALFVLAIYLFVALRQPIGKLRT